ncbi:unnamed protein product [Victoria cruziana]
MDALLSPHRRSQNPVTAFSSAPKKQTQSRGDFEGCTILLHRHRFLLTMLVLLAFLCTIYLYFAVTLGDPETCSGMNGAEKASCRLAYAKTSIRKGKVKLL